MNWFHAACDKGQVYVVATRGTAPPQVWSVGARVLGVRNTCQNDL